MKHQTVALVLATLFASRVGAAESLPLPEVLDLDNVIRLALDRNPTLKSVEEQQDQADAAIREAWADVYPQFDLNAGWNRNRNPSLLNSPDFDDIIDSIGWSCWP